MQVTIDGQRYVFQWEYEFDGQRVIDWVRQDSELVRYTSAFDIAALTFCRICIPTEKLEANGRPILQVVAEGVSACNRNDFNRFTFDRWKGRRNAFARAVQRAGFGEEARKQVWQAFMAQPRSRRRRGLPEVVRTQRLSYQMP